MFDVKVTSCPLHIVLPKLDVIITVGVNIGFTIIITGLDIALFGDTHKSEETILTVTLSPLFNVEVEKVGFTAPETSIPFILH